MSAHGIVDQIAADWREVIDGHDPGTDWGPDAKRLVDLALEGARRIENKRALRQAKVRLWCHRLGLIPEPERPKPVLPRRIQRRVGQPLPPGAVFVGKGSRWANPVGDRDVSPTHPLRGKDLACWCPPGAPCHADVLLLLANGVGA